MTPIHRREALKLIAGGAALTVAGCAGTGAVRRDRTGPLTLVHMTDTQLGMSSGSPDDLAVDLQHLRVGIGRINELAPDFAVITGDLINFAGREDHMKLLKKELDALQCPWYAVPGNHDEGGGPDPKLIDLYNRIFGDNYYSVQIPGCRLVAVDSCLFQGETPGLAEKQLAWLEEVFTEIGSTRGPDEPVLVILHHPPFVDTPDEVHAYFNIEPRYRKRLLSLCEQGGVTAILSGHTHRTILNTWHGIPLITAAPLSKVLGGPDTVGFRYYHWVGGRLEHRHVSLDL